MSRIGKLPVAIPAGVEVKLAEGNVITVKGPKGTLTRKLADDMNIAIEEGQVVVTRPNDLKRNKALHGLTRTLINNMIIGVTQGYEKQLEINGVGYRAAKSGKNSLFHSDIHIPLKWKTQKASRLLLMEQQKSLLRVLIKRRLDSSLLKSEQNVLLNLTKEKVSSMLMSTSDVK